MAHLNTGLKRQRLQRCVLRRRNSSTLAVNLRLDGPNTGETANNGMMIGCVGVHIHVVVVVDVMASCIDVVIGIIVALLIITGFVIVFKFNCQVINIVINPCNINHRIQCAVVVLVAALSSIHVRSTMDFDVTLSSWLFSVDRRDLMFSGQTLGMVPTNKVS